MDMTTLAAAQTSIKALYSLAKGATSAVVDNELKARMIDIQGGILDAQAKLGDAQAERMDLLQQVAELKDKVRRLETSQAALDAYKLHEVDPGKFLYRYTHNGDDSVDHFACPTCFNGGSVTVLQSSKRGSQQSLYYCQTCKFKLMVGPPDPTTPRVPMRSSYSREW